MPPCVPFPPPARPSPQPPNPPAPKQCIAESRSLGYRGCSISYVHSIRQRYSVLVPGTYRIRALRRSLFVRHSCNQHFYVRQYSLVQQQYEATLTSSSVVWQNKIMLSAVVRDIRNAHTTIDQRNRGIRRPGLKPSRAPSYE